MVKVQKVSPIIKKGQILETDDVEQSVLFRNFKKANSDGRRTDRQTDSFTQNNDNKNNNNNEIKSQNKKAVVFAFILMMFNKNS